MTGVEYIEEKIKKYPELYFVMCLWFEDAKKIENQKLIEMYDKGFDSVKQLNDEYAIEFGEYLDSLTVEDMGTTPIKDLLKIFKKEKEL